MTNSPSQKDRMRDDCVNTLVEIWYQILGTYRTNMTLLTRECLAVMRPYISTAILLSGVGFVPFSYHPVCRHNTFASAWIDLSLIVNDKFIPFFFECLSNTQLRREACNCITQVVAKGMPPLQKLDLIVRLKVLELVSSASTVCHSLLSCLSVRWTQNLILFSPQDDPQYKVNIAKLLNAAGVQLVAAHSKVRALLRNLMPFLLTENWQYRFKICAHKDKLTIR